MTDEPEVRVCPLGPPRKIDGRVCYAWCSECQQVRKSTLACPMIAAEGPR